MGGGVGIAREKARWGGARGMAGAVVDGGGVWFRGGVAARAGRGRRGAAVWPVVASGSGGVEFDDKLEALDFVSNGWKIY